METASLPSTEFTLCGDTFEIKPGDVVEPDGRICVRLHPGDKFSDSSYPGCQFRVPVENGGPIKSLAVNIKVTGRGWKWRPGTDQSWVRCRIEYVGDGEPSTYASGWLLCPRVTQDPNGWYAKHPVEAL